MTELEKRRAFGMVCEKCGEDVPDNASSGIKSKTWGTQRFTMFVYYCEQCSKSEGKLFPTTELRKGY
jgi:hypothetical protein